LAEASASDGAGVSAAVEAGVEALAGVSAEVGLARPGDGRSDFLGVKISEREEVFLMPGLDGTGPWGEGPMTGGGRGYCNPASAGYGPAYGRGYGRGRGFRRGFGPGFGWGRGYGRGYGWRGPSPAWGGWYGPPYGPYSGDRYAMSREDEINMLKDQADRIKEELNAINKRMEELEVESSES